MTPEAAAPAFFADRGCSLSEDGQLTADGGSIDHLERVMAVIVSFALRYKASADLEARASAIEGGWEKILLVKGEDPEEVALIRMSGSQIVGRFQPTALR